MALPTTPQDVTTEWLAGALAERHPDVQVVDSEVVEVQWGTATKVRVRCAYAADPGPDGPPRDLCLKAGLDERLAGFDTAECYRLEADFFNELAPDIDATIPRSWYAAKGEEQGIVVLDDLQAAGCSFGSPTRPWTADDVAAALEVQARWHGPFWGTSRDRFDWMDVGSTSVRAASAVLLGAEHWQSTFSADDAPDLPADAQDRERVVRAMRRLWELDDSGPLTVVHGDAHIGNTYTDPDGRPGFLDWQCVCLGPSLYDVAYFISGALPVADRRANERALLEHYLDALEACGGPRLAFDEAWTSYVHHVLHGLHWAVTPPVMQTPDRVAAMAERHLAAVDDHRSVSALLATI